MNRRRDSVPLALVHHANQYLITRGYDNREDIDVIVDGFTSVLGRHEYHDVPANLHLSGTLIEAIAWHRPRFLSMIAALRADGLVELVGGTYSENVMPLFDAAFNLGQLRELLDLYGHHLRCDPADVRAFWVPERVWDPGLCDVLTNPGLQNGGYAYVLLDDRLLFGTKGLYGRSARAVCDDLHAGEISTPGLPVAVHGLRCHRIAGGSGLCVVPISQLLRVRIPPSCALDERRLDDIVARALAAHDDDVLLTYADDFEKTAGVGSWDRRNAQSYDRFLEGLLRERALSPVLLSRHLDAHPPRQEIRVDAGTFYELARCWGAGEDYAGWWDDDAFFPYREHIDTALSELRAAGGDGVTGELVELASKHLMACTYETAWHDTTLDPPQPAPWTRALASHARAVLPILQAARSLRASRRRADIQIRDVDGDREDEVVLASDELHAVLTPRRGGRVIYLFARAGARDVALVGNPTDDWNWQEDLNAYLERPPNHPGALAEVGFEQDRYAVGSAGRSGRAAWVEMVNEQADGVLHGSRKRVLLVPEARALVACIEWPPGVAGLAVECCLSPDYLRLLRRGRAGLVHHDGPRWRGFANKDVVAWVARRAHEHTAFADAPTPEVGHGLNVRIRAECSHFHLAIGSGPVRATELDDAIERGVRLLHRVARPKTSTLEEVRTA